MRHQESRLLAWSLVGVLSISVGWQVAAAQTPAAAPKTTIVSPKNGDVVTGPSVHVVLAAQGIEIAAAAEKKPGTAHHHLFLDTNLTSPDSAIPFGVAGIVHLGKGQSEYTFDTVAPGSHRLIDVLADPNHVPLKPWVVDTVTFTVK